MFYRTGTFVFPRTCTQHLRGISSWIFSEAGRLDFSANNAHASVWISPTNGREISSSVYGTTRLGKLYQGWVFLSCFHFNFSFLISRNRPIVSSSKTFPRNFLPEDKLPRDQPIYTNRELRKNWNTNTNTKTNTNATTYFPSEDKLPSQINLSSQNGS